MKTVEVDLDKPVGRIKPLHGFNNTPRRVNYGDILPSFKRLAPPLIRLHDVAYPFGAGHWVDVPCVFPDFGRDPDDENAYDFTFTDAYIEPIVRMGADVMYRLGVSIEHGPKKYGIYPPSDPAKWARVCERIVAHYNDGWANGHDWGIKYWEIWNEPDGLDPDIEPNGPPMWLGTAEEYYRLYSLTANEIKQKHPDVLVGGYSSCYILGKNVGGRWQKGDISFFSGFLDYITGKETKAPLDFFTWHGYLGHDNISKIHEESELVADTLAKYGFGGVPRINAEWNCCVCDKETDERRKEYYINFRNEKGASHCAAALFEMQRSRTDMALYYDAQLWLEYGGLYEVPSLEPSRTFRVFEAFARAYRLGEQYHSTNDGDVYTLAAGDGTQTLLLVANISERPQTVYIKSDALFAPDTVTLTDREHDAQRADVLKGNILYMPAYSLAELRCTG